jgi:hypothetical protein
VAERVPDEVAVEVTVLLTDELAVLVADVADEQAGDDAELLAELLPVDDPEEDTVRVAAVLALDVAETATVDDPVLVGVDDTVDIREDSEVADELAVDVAREVAEDVVELEADENSEEVADELAKLVRVDDTVVVAELLAVLVTVVDGHVTSHFKLRNVSVWQCSYAKFSAAAKLAQVRPLALLIRMAPKSHTVSYSSPRASGRAGTA